MVLARLAGLALIAPMILAQGSWGFSNPKPHGNNITDLGQKDGVVWQVGDRGRIYTSIDLETWTPHETGVRNSLRGIAFFKGQTFISGEAGLILSGAAPDAMAARSLNTGDWLEGIAASSTSVVAVGDNGAIYQSTDGQSWNRRGNYTTWLRSVAYGGGQFVCVGESGFIATSTDGQGWQTRNTATGDLNRVVFINDRFWVAGNGGVILTNDNRMVFIPVNVGVTNDLWAIAGNSTDIIVAGDLIVLSGKVPGGTWTSEVGREATDAPSWPYYSALWNGSVFLIGGRTGMKVDGARANDNAPLEWRNQPQPTRNWLWGVTRAPELYAAVGAEGTVVTSEDGFTWTREVTPLSSRSEILLGVGGNGNSLVAAGSAGLLLTSPNILTSNVSTNAAGQLETNTVSLLGLYWNAVQSGTGNDLQGVAAKGTTYVVTGARGTILTSPDGTNWTSRASGTSAYLSGVTAYPNGFIACGDAGVVLQSADGILWFPRNSGVNSWVYAVRYAGGKLVAVGQGGLILTSDDGVRWTKQTSGTTEWINDVAFAPGRWVAVAGSGTLVTSPDAVNWTASKSITSRSLYSVATDGTQFVTTGLDGVILRQELAAPQSPINFLSYGIAGSSSFFLFGGAVGQRFTLESSGVIHGGWAGEATLEITDSSGTLIHQRPNTREQSRFFRTHLLP